VGSWLDARSAGGEWLLRIEDLDGRAFGFRGTKRRSPPSGAPDCCSLCSCSRRDIAAAGLGDEPRCVGTAAGAGPGTRPGATALALRPPGRVPAPRSLGIDIHFDPLRHHT
jgi:hypothetical protein